MSPKSLFLFICLFVITFKAYSADVKREDYFKVHLIPHTHIDAGWLSTFEGYYDSHVGSIIPSVIKHLEKNKERTFMWSEIGYLERWWRTASEEDRGRFTKLLKEGQIEIINGGWVMNDEACPTVDATIRHLTDGHRFIVEHFGTEYLPKTGWQIDPFGHSAIMPYIQAQMGYQHLILNRILWTHHERFKKDRNLEFIWRGSPNTLGPKSDILTFVVDDFYVSPPNLNFENQWIRSQSTEQLVQTLIGYAHERGNCYLSPNVFIPLGGDFNYVNAEYYFDKVDPIVQETNRRFEQGTSNVKVEYSTLAKFFNETIEWHKAKNAPFGYFEEDFFPYAEREPSWWTGYYTSRPLLKGQVRSVSSKIRSAEIFSSFQDEDFFSLIQDSSRNVSILQHHDAVTGTARPNVVDDYAHRLNHADGQLNQVLTKTMSNIVVDQSQAPLALTAISEYPDIEVIRFDDNQDKKSIIISNSLNWARRDVYQLKISTSDKDSSSCPYYVTSSGKDTDDSLSCDCSLVAERKIDQQSKETIYYYKLDFYIDIQAFGIKTFYIHKTKKGQITNTVFNAMSNVAPKQIHNTIVSFDISSENQLLSAMTNSLTNERIELGQKLMDYQDNGGAYIMLSYSDAQEPKREATIQYYNGELCKEYHVYYKEGNGFESLIKFKLYNSTKDLELNKKMNFNFIVQGKSSHTTVNRFKTSLDSKIVYSDNGVELHKRKIPVDENHGKNPHKYYYPSISIGMIRDEVTETTLACIGDRSRGVASLRKGEFEFAIHRNLDHDDQKGLDYPPRDSAWINVKSTCYLDHFYTLIKSVRHESLKIENPLRSYQVNSSSENNHIEFTGLNHQLPNNIHIMSLEKSIGDKDTYTIRAMNIREEGPPTTFDVTNLLPFHKGTSSYIKKEFNLASIVDYSANEILNYMPYANFSVIDPSQQLEMSKYPPRFTPITSKSSITLLPLEIKSFSITLRK